MPEKRLKDFLVVYLLISCFVKIPKGGEFFFYNLERENETMLVATLWNFDRDVKHAQL